MSVEPSERSHVFYCYAPDLRPLAVLLSTVHFSTRANFRISDAGIHVGVEAGKTMQANAYMEKESFSEWSYNPPPNRSSVPPRGPLQSQFNSSPSSSNNRGEARVDSQARDPNEEEQEDNESQFEVSLTALIECLNVFGTASSTRSHSRSSPEPSHQDQYRNGDGDNESDESRRFRMRDEKNKSKKQQCSAIRITYEGEGYPLVLLIEDSGVVTRCELVTYEPGEMSDMTFPADRQVVQLILKSDWLRSSFALFDDKTASDITFIFSPPLTTATKEPRPKRPRQSTNKAIPPTHNVASHPYFRIQVEGSLGSSAVDFPNDKDILESFTCKLPPGLDQDELEEFGSVNNSYKLSHILKFRKALDVSSKASLRVDDTGLLSLQLLIWIDDHAGKRRRKGYVEFLCVPLERE